MAHDHSLYDTDMHFLINTIEKTIKNQSKKTIVVRGDHNSERFTFEIPRYVEGHDMSLCNLVQIHYLNVDFADIYRVKDLQVYPDDDSLVVFSWKLERKATQKDGGLHFAIHFKCVAEDGTVEYEFRTIPFKEITVAETIDNTEAIVEEYPDILAKWEARLNALEQNGGGSGGKGINNMFVSSQDIPLESETSTVDIRVIYTDDTSDNLSFLVPHGPPGKDYVLTDEDKAEIAEQAAELVEVPEGGITELKTVNNQSISGAGNISTAQIVNLLPSLEDAKENTIYVLNNDVVLPEEYVRLGGIKSQKINDTTAPYIELPFGYNTNTKYEIEAKLNLKQTETSISVPFGTGWDYGGMMGVKGRSTLYGDGTNETRIPYGTAVKYNQVINGDSTVSTITAENGEIYSFSRTNSLTTYATSNYPIGKIVRQANNYYPKELNIYYMKIKIDDVLMYDLIPAKRITDNVVGLYDTVNDVFYSSFNSSVGFSEISYVYQSYIFIDNKFISIGSGSSENNIDTKSSHVWVNPEIKKFNIIAHRGLHSTAVSQENTIEAFEAAYQAGYNYIECDVIPTSDGFVIHHDKVVNGNTLTSMTTEEVITAIPYIPTVESVIKWAKKRNMCVDLDTAGRVNGLQLSALYDLVKKYNMLGNVVFTSYQDNLDFLISNKKTNCNVCLTYMNTTPTATLINTIPQAIISVFNHFEVSINNAYLSDAAMIEVCHNRNITCRTWTLNSEASCLNFINMGIDKIFVDADILWELNE